MIIILPQFTNFFNDCPMFLADVDKKAIIFSSSPDGSDILRFFGEDIAYSGTITP
jgi:hypothetical protein